MTTHVSVTMDPGVAEITRSVMCNGSCNSGYGHMLRCRCSLKYRHMVVASSRKPGSLTIIWTIKHGVYDDMSRLLNAEKLMRHRVTVPLARQTG